MNGIVSSAVVLHRLNYGEANKIITVITPEHGKVKLMARGVRKIKSKLAGGIELFSVSNITFIKGKNDISTLASTRLTTYFHHIVEDIDRTMAGYDMLKMLHSHTQDSCDSDYYRLILQALTYLNDTDISPQLTKTWFVAQLLHLQGGFPNIEKTLDKKSFTSDINYQYDPSESGFIEHTSGVFSFNHLKVFKLLRDETPQRLHVINGVQQTITPILNILDQQLKNTK